MSPKAKPGGRGDVLRTALKMLTVLRRGRWTMAEAADEVGVHWRAAYRIVDALRAAGVTVEVSRERDDGAPGIGAGYYSVPADPLRRLLKL
jgi:predicted DNA-binding transcriptional regulator YafY